MIQTLGVSPIEGLRERSFVAADAHRNLFNRRTALRRTRDILSQSGLVIPSEDHLERAVHDLPDVLWGAYSTVYTGVVKNSDYAIHSVGRVEIGKPLQDLDLLEATSALCTVAAAVLREANPGLEVVDQQKRRYNASAQQTLVPGKVVTGLTASLVFIFPLGQ